MPTWISLQDMEEMKNDLFKIIRLDELYSMDMIMVIPLSRFPLMVVMMSNCFRIIYAEKVILWSLSERINDFHCFSLSPWKHKERWGLKGQVVLIFLILSARDSLLPKLYYYLRHWVMAVNKSAREDITFHLSFSPQLYYYYTALTSGGNKSKREESLQFKI